MRVCGEILPKFDLHILEENDRFSAGISVGSILRSSRSLDTLSWSELHLVAQGVVNRPLRMSAKTSTDFGLPDAFHKELHQRCVIQPREAIRKPMF